MSHCCHQIGLNFAGALGAKAITDRLAPVALPSPTMTDYFLLFTREGYSPSLKRESGYWFVKPATSALQQNTWPVFPAKASTERKP